MGSSRNQEAEAAMFMENLIRDSKDDPLNLATELYTVCGHMKLNGNDQSQYYQTVSRAMETVMNQNGIDIEAVKQNYMPLKIENLDKKNSMDNPAPGSKGKEGFYGGSGQSGGVARDRHDPINLSRPPVGTCRADSTVMRLRHDPVNPNRVPAGADIVDLTGQGRSSTLEIRTASSQGRRDPSKPVRGRPRGSKNVPKNDSAKRRRGDSALYIDANTGNLQQSGYTNTGFNSGTGKMMMAAQRSQNSINGTQLTNSVLVSTNSKHLQQGLNMPESLGFCDQSRNVLLPGNKGNGSQGPLSKGNFDVRNFPSTQAHFPSSMSRTFTEHELRQINARHIALQSLRNGVSPKKSSLGVAQGDYHPEQGGSADGATRELCNRKEATSKGLMEKHNPGSSLGGGLVETDISPTNAEDPGQNIYKTGFPSDHFALPGEWERLLAAGRNLEVEMGNREATESLDPHSLLNTGKTLSESNHKKSDSVAFGDTMYSSVLGRNKPPAPVISDMPGIVSYDDSLRETSAAVTFQYESVAIDLDSYLNELQILPESVRVKEEFPVFEDDEDICPPGFPLKKQTNPVSGFDVAQPQADVVLTSVLPGESTTTNNFRNAFSSGVNVGLVDQRVSANQKHWISDKLKTFAANDASDFGNLLTQKENFARQEGTNKSICTERPPSPNYTFSEKWTVDHQKMKVTEEQNLVLKHKTASETIAASDKLKASQIPVSAIVLHQKTTSGSSVAPASEAPHPLAPFASQCTLYPSPMQFSSEAPYQQLPFGLKETDQSDSPTVQMLAAIRDSMERMVESQNLAAIHDSMERILESQNQHQALVLEAYAKQQALLDQIRVDLGVFHTNASSSSFQPTTSAQAYQLLAPVLRESQLAPSLSVMKGDKPEAIE